jgi:NAD(P)-dependent dehydrogenase (short-subunit alcohol dehydrogenase family)
VTVATLRAFVSGSTDGIGLATAQELIRRGHHVVAHARTAARATEMRSELVGAEAILVADLASQQETRDLAAMANDSGAFDVIVHNAGIGSDEPRRMTPDGVEHVLAINAVAPYLLTAMMTPPRRMMYVTSGQHLNGTPSTDDLDWRVRNWDPLQAYADSKLFESTVAFAVARLWPSVITNTLEPGWVPTKMANYDAPDDLALAHMTQIWLAESEAPEALRSAGYYYHQRPQPAHPVARSEAFQSEVLEHFRRLTGVRLPEPGD